MKTIWLLVITVALGLVFYLPKEVGRWWTEFNNPETITIYKPIGDSPDLSAVVGFTAEADEPVDAKAVVERLLEGLPGNYGIWVDQGLAIKADKVYTAASVIKLPVLTAYYQAVDAGNLDPEEIYTLVEADRWQYGTGNMQNQPEGTKYTYREIAKLAANQSDNMGAEVLIKKLGGYSAAQRTVNGWGLTDTNLKENETTPEEIGDLLKRLEEGKLLTPDSREELFTNLTNTINEDRLPAGVPSGVTVVHKFGSEEGVVNDCGTVMAKKPYVVCVLSTGINAGEAEVVLPKISRVIWEWLWDK